MYDKEGKLKFFVLFLLFNWLVDCGSTVYHSKSYIYIYIYIPYCSSKTALRFTLFIQSNRNNNKKNQMLPRSKWRQIAGFSRWLSLYVLTVFCFLFSPHCCVVTSTQEEYSTILCAEQSQYATDISIGHSSTLLLLACTKASVD